jgi:hypothetical protein
MSMSAREETSLACGEVAEKARMETPREDSLVLAAFETEVGLVKEMMLLGLMLDGCVRRPLTIEEPVWPVAPTMPIVGAIVGFVAASFVVLMFLVSRCIVFWGVVLYY